MKYFFGITTAICCLFVFYTASAKEIGFVPLLADIDQAKAGAEVITVSHDGSLLATGQDGQMLIGFPVLLPDAVFISSPLLISYQSGESSAIMVFARNTQQQLWVYAIGMDGAILASKAQLGSAIVFDPITVPGQFYQDSQILYVSDIGRIVRVRYDGQALSNIVLYNLGVSSKLWFDEDTLQVFAQAPASDEVTVFNWWGDQLQLQQTEPGNEPVSAPRGVSSMGVIVSQNARALEDALIWPYASNSAWWYDATLYQQKTNSLGLPLRPFSVQGTNILVDGHMEYTGIAAWRGYSAPAVMEKSSRFSYRGRQSLHIDTTDPNNRSGGIQAINIPVQAGKSYFLRFYYKLYEGTLYPRLGIRSSNSDFEGKGDILAIASGDWSVYERAFTVPDNFVGDFRLVIHTRRAKVYFDDISITPQTVQSLLPDGDMESLGVANWLAYSHPQWNKTSEQVYAGRQSMWINTLDPEPIGGGFQKTHLTLEPGQAYRFSFQYNVLAGQVYPRLGIHSSNGDFEQRVDILGQTGGQWQQYVREFVVPEDFVDDFRIVVTTRRAQVYIDELVLEKIEAPKVLQDGDMEQLGSAAWRPYGKPEVLSKTGDQVYEGLQSMHVATPGSGAGFQQTQLQVAAGQTYELTFAYKIDQGTAYPRLGINTSNGDFEGFFVKLSSTHGEWKTYTRTFTIPEDFSGDFRFVLSTRDAEVYIDSVSIDLLP